MNGGTRSMGRRQTNAVHLGPSQNPWRQKMAVDCSPLLSRKRQHQHPTNPSNQTIKRGNSGRDRGCWLRFVVIACFIIEFQQQRSIAIVVSAFVIGSSSLPSSASSSFLTCTTATTTQAAATTTMKDVTSSTNPTTSSSSSSTIARNGQLMTIAFATAKRRRRLPNHKQLTQQLLEQMKLVTDTQEALQLFHLPLFRYHETTTIPTSDDDHHHAMLVDDDQVFVDALHLCSKARRYDVALAIYPQLCSTEACRQMAIYACGKCMGQEQRVLDLLSMKTIIPVTTTAAITATASIASYNTALTVLDWQRAYQLLLNDMVHSPPLRPNDDDNSTSTTTTTVLDVLSCNIVLHAMAKAHRGDEALGLWKSMTSTTITTPTGAPRLNRPVFPRPDRCSWHHVMTACLSSSHRKIKHGDGSPEQQEQGLQQGRAVYFDLFLPLVAIEQTDGHATGTNNMGKIAFVPNHQTYDLLSRGFSKMGDWDMVRLVEGHRKGQEHQPPPQASAVIAPLLPHAKQQNQQTTASPSSLLSDDINDKKKKKDELENQYYYFQLWTGMTKVGRGDTAYWLLGTYKHYYRSQKDGDERTECSTWRVALQPNRNPSKNGIKLLFLVQDKAAVLAEQEKISLAEHPQQDSGNIQTPFVNMMNERKTWKKLGYVLMINARDSQHDHAAAAAASSAIDPPTSTLLGLFIDPVYRKHGLSKTFLAIWLSCCRQAHLQPQTGLIRKPLLALVLEHTFGFTPMIATSNARNNMINSDDAAATATAAPQGVEVEIYIPPPANSSDNENSNTNNSHDGGALRETTTTMDATKNNGDRPTDSSNTLTASASIHLYSPYGKGLQGTFSPWDLFREGIVIDSHPPPPGSRGRRTIHLMCNFVSSMPDTMMEERIASILSGTPTSIRKSNAESASGVSSNNNLTLVLSGPELQNVFLGT